MKKSTRYVLWIFAIPAAIALILATSAIIISWYFYTKAAKPIEEFYSNLGELALQIAIIVIVGAVVKSLIDWSFSIHTRQIEKQESRKELLRRMREIHVTIANAKDLMNAHQSALTWAEQSMRLMNLRPELEDLSEDIEVSHNLFLNKNTIVGGIEGIVTYLEKSGDEYINCHKAVAEGNRNNQKLEDTIEYNNMIWVRDFMDEGKIYETEYDSNLKKSKGIMRKEIYST